MDFGALLLLGFFWFVFSLVREAAKRGSARGSARQAPSGKPNQGQPRSSPRPQPLPVPSGTDPTQREGSRLEGLLRDLNRSLEQVAGAGVPADVATVETDVSRPLREEVDQDDTAEQVVARRIAAAEARNAALGAADHQRFDQRIRQEPADHTAVRTYSPKQLRDAIVWRELLGPPVALRNEGPSEG